MGNQVESRPKRIRIDQLLLDAPPPVKRPRMADEDFELLQAGEHQLFSRQNYKVRL
jgi:hypothetical protein